LLSGLRDKCADPCSAAQTMTGIRIRVCLMRCSATHWIRGQRALHASPRRRRGLRTHAPAWPVHVFRAEPLVRWPPQDGQPKPMLQETYAR